MRRKSKRKQHDSLSRSFLSENRWRIYDLCNQWKRRDSTVCFFSTASKDDAITLLIYVSLISAISHFDVHCHISKNIPKRFLVCLLWVQRKGVLSFISGIFNHFNMIIHTITSKSTDISLVYKFKFIVTGPNMISPLIRIQTTNFFLLDVCFLGKIWVFQGCHFWPFFS